MSTAVLVFSFVKVCSAECLKHLKAHGSFALPVVCLSLPPTTPSLDYHEINTVRGTTLRTPISTASTTLLDRSNFLILTAYVLVFVTLSLEHLCRIPLKRRRVLSDVLIMHTRSLVATHISVDRIF